MDSKKYEQLINFIINEEEDKAKELFHEIVVEQSRGIYESIMAEEMMGVDEDEHMGGDVGDLMDEITAEEEGVSEDEDEEVKMDSEKEEDFGGEESEEIFDLEADSEEDDSSEEVEDAVVRIEDKLDELMGEFEEILGKMDDEGEEKEEVEVDSEEEVESDSEEDEDMMQEAIQLQKVSPHHGDDGDQKQSPVAANSGKEGMDSDPVDYSGGGDEKGRPAPQAKDVKDADSFKNAPAGKAKVDLSSAPKPVTKDGAENDKSPYAK